MPPRPPKSAAPSRTPGGAAIRSSTRKPLPAAAPSYHHGALREALLTAAEAILEDVGVEGFTLRECARRAGVSHAAPAHHFGDARGLLSACAAGGFQRLAAQMVGYTEQAGADPDARLLAVGRAYVDFALAHRALFQLMFRRDRLADTHPELADSGPRAFDQLRIALADAMHAHGVPPEHGPLRSLFAWALVHGYATLVLEGQCESGFGLSVDRPEVVQQAGEALLGLAGRALMAPG